MKQSEVVVGGEYAAKVSGKLVRVRVTQMPGPVRLARMFGPVSRHRERLTCLNLSTNREIRCTAARLRRLKSSPPPTAPKSADKFTVDNLPAPTITGQTPSPIPLQNIAPRTLEGDHIRKAFSRPGDPGDLRIAQSDRPEQGRTPLVGLGVMDLLMAGTLKPLVPKPGAPKCEADSCGRAATLRVNGAAVCSTHVDLPVNAGEEPTVEDII